MFFFEKVHNCYHIDGFSLILYLMLMPVAPHMDAVMMAMKYHNVRDYDDEV
jgi:hypothetical protein